MRVDSFFYPKEGSVEVHCRLVGYANVLPVEKRQQAKKASESCHSWTTRRSVLQRILFLHLHLRAGSFTGSSDQPFPLMVELVIQGLIKTKHQLMSSKSGFFVS